MEWGIQLDPDGRARSAVSELVGACKALPDFDTLQIVRFPITPPPLACWCGRNCSSHVPSREQWDRALAEQTKDLEGWSIDCLKQPRTGCLEGEGRKTTFRVIQFSSCYPTQSSVKVEEREVWRFDSKDP